MLDLATIGIAMDTSGLEKGAAALKNTEQAANKAADAADKVGTHGKSGFSEYEKAAAMAQRQTSSMQSSIKSMESVALQASKAMATFFAVERLASFATAAFNASTAAQRLTTQLNFASSGNSAKEMAFVTGIANTLGLQLNSTAQAYAGFASAARGTSMEGEKTRAVFESISQASAVMGLTTDQTSGALLAVQQMMSKGVVNAEEFRGQLGERMPIALQAGAKALNVTTAEFSKMMETGQIVASDFLPKFAVAIKEMLGDSVTAAADRMDAATARMGNAWEKLMRTVGDSGVSKAMANEAQGLSNYMDGLSDAMLRAKQSGSGLVGELNAGLAQTLARMPFDVVALSANSLNGAINSLSGGALHLRTNLNLLPDSMQTSAQQAATLGVRLADAEKDLAQLQSKLALSPDDIYLKSETYQAFLLAQQLRAAKQAKDDYAGGGAGRGAVNPQTIEQIYAAQNKLNDAMEKYAPKIEKVNKAVEEMRKAHGALFTPAMEKQMRDSMNPPKAAGASVISEATKGLALYNDLMATSVKVNANYTEDQAKLNAGLQGGKLSTEQYTSATQALVAKQPYMVEVAKEAVKAFDEEAKFRAKATEAYIKQLDARVMADADVAQMASDYARTADDANQRAALELSLMYESSSARDIALAQYDIELKLQKQILEIKQKLASLPDQDAAIASVTATAARESLAVASKVKNAEWSKYVQQYSSIFQKGFVDMVNGGTDTWKSFTKSLVTTFKTSVADQIYKMFAQPFVMRIVGSLLGITGAGMAGSATAQSAGASAMTNLSVAQTLKGAYDVYTGGLSASYASAANTGYGSSLGLSTAPAGGLTGATAGELAYTNALANGSTVAQANTAAIQANTANLTTTGSTLGSALGLVSSAVAGISIGSAIAGDKIFLGMSGTESSALGVVLGAVGSYFGGPWGYAAGMLVGGIIGGVVNAAFGHGSTEVVTEGVRGTLANTGFSGEMYANLKQPGGWFTQDDNWTETRSVRESTSSVLDAAFAGTKISIAKLAVSLGLSTDKIASYTKYIDIAAGTSNDAIQALFVGMGDEMSAQLLSGKAGQVGAFDEQYYLAQNPDVRDKSIWSGTAKQHFDYGGRNEGRAQNAQSMVSTGKDYTYLQRQIKDAKTGDMVQETATQTLTRLSDSLKGANTWLAVLDQSLISVSMDGAEAATKLSDLFGGDAKMAEANKSYYDNFWSNSEKLADTTLNVSKGLALVGQAMPASKDAFRDVVSGLDLTTDAGRSTYAVMLALAPEFAQVADTAAAAADGMAKAATDAAKAVNDALIAAQKATADQADGLLTQWLQLTGDTVALRKQELAAIEGVNQAMQQQIWAYQDAQDALTAASTASDSALNGIQKSLDAQKTSQTAAVTAVKGIFDLLKSEIDKLYGQVASTTAMAASEGNAFIETALALAKAGGVMPDQAALGKASAAVQSGFGNEAAQFEADRSRLVLAGQLQQLKDIAGPQLTDAEAQLAATNDAYDVAKTQLDTLRGINDSTLSVAAAVEAFQVAFTGEATARQKLAAAASPVASSGGSGGGGDSQGFSGGLINLILGSSASLLTQSATNSINAGIASSGLAYAEQAMNIAQDMALNSTGAVQASAIAWANANSVNVSGIASRESGGSSSHSAYVTAANAAIARNVDLPSFDVGTNYVPHDMTANIHKGEEITPRPYVDSQRSARDAGNALLQRLLESNEKLTEEVVKLRAQVDTSNQNTRRTADAVNGNPERPMPVEVI